MTGPVHIGEPLARAEFPAEHPRTAFLRKWLAHLAPAERRELVLMAVQAEMVSYEEAEPLLRAPN